MRWVLPVVLAFVGCTDTSQFLALPPGAEDARTLILALEVDDTVSVQVHDLGDSSPIRIMLDDRRANLVTALVYGASPDALGVPLGMLPPSATDVCGATELPDTDDIFVFAPDESTWTAADRSDPINDFRWLTPCPCPVFTSERIVNLPYRTAFSSARLSGSEALVYVSNDLDSELLSIRRDSHRVIDLGPPHMPFTTFVDGETIWLGQGDKLFRGTVADGFVLTATVPALSGPIVSVDGTDDDLFVMTEEADLFHFDSTTLTRWYTRGSVPAGAAQRGRVRRLGPNNVLAVLTGMLDTVRFENGQPRERYSVVDETRGIAELEWIDDFGFLMIAAHSEAFRLNAGELTPLSAPFIAEATAMVTTAPDTAAYSTAAGEIQPFVVGYGFCPTVRPLDGPRIEQMIALDDALLTIGPAPGEVNTLRLQVLVDGR